MIAHGSLAAVKTDRIIFQICGNFSIRACSINLGGLTSKLQARGSKAFFRRGYSGCGDEMKKPVDFKRFAEDCIRLAAVVTPIEDKAILLSMGETWLRLAEHAGSVQALLEGDGSQTS